MNMLRWIATNLRTFLLAFALAPDRLGDRSYWPRIRMRPQTYPNPFD